jgi:hypothetical protein
MLALVIAVIALISLAVLIGIEIRRSRTKAPRRTTTRTVPRRQPLLEDRIRSAFDGPREKHGDIFVSYAIWKRDQETRLELFASDPFAQLNEFTRCLIVRHLWRALEALAEGSVVVVDAPHQTWSKAIDASFNDRGIDPWRLAPDLGGLGGPQFAKE